MRPVTDDICSPAERRAAGIPDVPPPYASDRTDNYELGVKTRLLGGRLRIDGAAYAIDWKDYQQAFQTACGINNATTISFTVNAGRVRSRGGELELSLSPIRGLDLHAGGSFTDATYRNAVPNLLLPAGSRVLDVPRWLWNVRGTYEAALAERLTGTLFAAARHVGATDSGFGEGEVLPRPAYTLVDASAGIRVRGGLGVELFVTNLFDAVPVFGPGIHDVAGQHHRDQLLLISRRTAADCRDTPDHGVVMAGMDASTLNGNPPAAGQAPGARWYNAVWRWHFYAGLFCIPFVLWLALTGTIYLWRPQLEGWLDRSYDYLPVASPTFSPDAQIGAVVRAVPGSSLHKYVLPESPRHAVRIIVAAGGVDRRVYVDPHSLAVLNVVREEDRPLNVVSRLHGELLAGAWGSYLVEIAACWTIVMLLTGLYLWWPRNRKGLAGVLYPRLSSGTRLVLARYPRHRRHLGVGIRTRADPHRPAMGKCLGKLSGRSSRAHWHHPRRGRLVDRREGTDAESGRHARAACRA